MTMVKICGLKHVEHVLAVVEAKADFIGFVFAPSKRQVTLEQAKQLAVHIPKDIKKVGVFVNAEPAFIKQVYTEVGLDYIQYHGDESPTFINQIGLPAIKAFSINEAFDEQTLYAYDVDYYLLDAPGETHRGGSGKTFNWDLIERLSISKEKVILAGGLNATNVSQALSAVQPCAVDVSSGVELDGEKNSTLINEFVKTVKEVPVYE